LTLKFAFIYRSATHPVLRRISTDNHSSTLVICSQHLLRCITLLVVQGTLHCVDATNRMHNTVYTQHRTVIYTFDGSISPHPVICVMVRYIYCILFCHLIHQYTTIVTVSHPSHRTTYSTVPTLLLLPSLHCTVV